ncbi:hypothetical protein N6H05_11685 [Sphingobium sp. WTD-1]|uniref:hypothetical protein n=1 Tax=Sphingobium sp. WTD-1 TaxID=2979467 RepID=UPI0024DE6611|nr:hypothetical protein [Sphingobium sp. WTD-1]WIA58415.1 hypothetical protein N6H05_11685 [Sphingobium sp. WTD-1]
MLASIRHLLLYPLGGMALLSGCAGQREVAVAPPPPAQLQPVPQPLPPLGATATMQIPPIGADGQRVTPNRDLSGPATLWHMRMALNVAALSCQGSGDAARLQYNQMLVRHRTALTRANAQVEGEYKAQFGGAAIAQRERLNTVVYNFFALPPAQAGFCAEAVRVGAAVNSLPTDQLQAYAPAGLAALEKPFTDFFDAYARYQTDLAAWRSGRALAMAPASSAPVVLEARLSRADLIADDGVIAPKGTLPRLLARAD